MSQKLKITFLGCGDSAGVPRIGGDWGNCDPTDPKNRRTRPSILVQSATTTIVVDTGPDFGLQLTRENIKTVDAILYTHDHNDHVTGIDDVRILQSRMNGKKMPLYMNEITYEGIRQRNAYLFEQTSPYYPVVVDVNLFNADSYGKPHQIGDIEFTVFEQDHGQGNISLGYRFGGVGYSTDMRNLEQPAIDTLKGIHTWIADCADLGHGHGVLHANMPTLQRLNAQIGAKQVYLTHLKMFYDYQQTVDAVPEGYEPAYDGLVINTEI